MDLFDDILADFKTAFRQAMIDSDHLVTGEMANSMKWETTIISNGYLITISLKDYAYWLENGRKPGKFPPVNKIKEWVRARRILPRPLPNGKLPTENQLAYLIGRKISKVGTKPTHLIENTMSDFQLLNKLLNKLADELQKEIEKESFSAEITG